MQTWGDIQLNRHLNDATSACDSAEAEQDAELFKYVTWIVGNRTYPLQIKSQITRRVFNIHADRRRSRQSRRNDEINQVAGRAGLFAEQQQDQLARAQAQAQAQSQAQGPAQAQGPEQEQEQQEQEISNKGGAMCCGLNYTGSAHELRGCISDAKNIRRFAIDAGWGDGDITMMTDISGAPSVPTRGNILREFRSMVRGIDAGRVGLFYYSGHGTYDFDRNGDELTGYDQMLYSLDDAVVADDELSQIIRSELKEGATLVALTDCCFSGSLLDLKYSYKDSLHGGGTAQETDMNANARAADTRGDVIMISGCHDLQTSAEATIERAPQGAMTWAFLSSMEVPGLSWRGLLDEMRSLLAERGFSQIPQLSSGRPMDMDQPISQF